MAFQNKSFAANSVLTAPCGAEAFDIISTAAFNIQYIDFNDGVPIGDAVAAVPFGASSFKTTIYAPRGYAWSPAQKMALVSGATQPTIVQPVRFGN